MITTNPSATKKGPGRHHKQGFKHGKPPVQPMGNWLGQHTNPLRKQLRAKLIKQHGRRQALKAIKAMRRAA